jgi:hypothetical protein
VLRHTAIRLVRALEEDMFSLRPFAIAVVLTFTSVPSVWGPASAQEPATGQVEPEKPVFTLSGDAAVVTFLIKPDKTADFELVLRRLRDALAQSENVHRKQQAAGWKVFKSDELAQGNAVYVMRIEPVLAGEEYDITRLIAEAFPVEVQDLFVKYKNCLL